MPRRLAVCLTLLATSVWAESLSMSQKLRTGARIEIKQGSSWRRGVVSDDSGPGSVNIKVRVDPTNDFLIVPRNSVRPAPVPASINVGDRLEWYDPSVFKYMPATVKHVGAGTFAGMYRMVPDATPNAIGNYTKPANLWLLPEGSAATSGVASTAKSPEIPAGSGPGPLLGKYRCFAYGRTSAPPLFLGDFELRGGGVYFGKGKEGRYSYDAGSKTITWSSGWMKDNNFAGTMDGNAKVRIARTSVCTHE